MDDKDTFEVQRLFPQIYLACHVDHVRAISTPWEISSRDASILAHLDSENATSPPALAEHLSSLQPDISVRIAKTFFPDALGIHCLKIGDAFFKERHYFLRMQSILPRRC